MRRSQAWLLVLALAPGCRAGKSTGNQEMPPAKPTVRARGIIVGEVADADAPLAGGRVCARRLGPTVDFVADDVAAICTTTDAGGRFELKVTAGIYFVSAAVDEHLPRGVEVVVSSTQLEPSVRIVLTPGGRAYAGTVVDLDGRPIAGAKVSFTDHLGPRAVASTRGPTRRGASSYRSASINRSSR